MRYQFKTAFLAPAVAAWPHRCAFARAMGRIAVLATLWFPAAAMAGPYDDNMSAGDKLFEQNHFQESARRFEDAIHSGEGDQAQAYYKAGMAYSRIPDDRRALDLLNTSLKLDPNIAYAYADRGRVLMDLQQWSGAWQDISKFLQLKPDDYYGHFLKGNWLDKNGHEVEAVPEYDKVIASHPIDAPALAARGRCYMKLRQYQKALSDFNQALTIDTHIANVRYERGEALLNLGQTDQAIAALDEALRVNPRHGAAYRVRGDAYKRLKQWPRAVDDYTHAVQLHANDMLAWRSRAECYMDLQQYQKAIDDFDIVLRGNPGDSIALATRATAYGHLGHSRRALSELNQAIKMNPNEPSFYANRSAALGKLGANGQSIGAMVASLDAMNLKTAKQFEQRGRKYFNLKRYDQATQDFTRALELEPTFWMALMERAVTYERTGRGDLAIADYDRTIAAHPNDVAYRERGQIRCTLHQFPAALADINQAIKLNPYGSKAYYARSELYRLVGKSKWAEDDHVRAEGLADRERLQRRLPAGSN